MKISQLSKIVIIRFAVTQTPVKDNQLMLLGKNRMQWNYNNDKNTANAGVKNSQRGKIIKVNRANSGLGHLSRPQNKNQRKRKER